MSTDLITIKDICQKVFDFFTIFADLLVRWPIEDGNLLSLICFISIAFVAILLGAFGVFLVDISHKGKNRTLNIFNFVAGISIFGCTILGLILSLLLLAKPDAQNVLPTTTPSFTHTRYSNIVIESPKRQIYMNNSKVNFAFSYDNDDEHIYLETDDVNAFDVKSIFDNQSSIIGNLIGAKGDSNNSVYARLKKENVHIIETKNAKKYPDYVSYKISKIEVEDGTATKTAYHQAKNIKIKELYLEITADVTPDRLKDAQENEQDHKNQKDIDQLLNN